MTTKRQKTTAKNNTTENGLFFDIYAKLAYVRKMFKNKLYKKAMVEKDPLDLLMRKASVMSSQSYGPLIEKRLMYDLNLDRVSKSLKRGDAFSKSLDEHLEIKVSLITETNTKINVVQIRMGHDIDSLLLMVADVRVEKVVPEVYYIPHRDLEGLFKMSSAHGIGREVFEKRVSVPMDKNNETYKRLQGYRVKYKDLIKKFS